MELNKLEIFKKVWMITFSIVCVVFIFSSFFSKGQAASVTKSGPEHQLELFENLPPGSAPALTKAMLKDLPAEYQLRENEGTFSMSNPSHGMEITFTPRGPQITSGGKNWAMTMTGLGYEGSIKPVGKAKLMNDDGMLVYDRGDVAEWYLNSRWGVEQGFTINSAPDERSRKLLVVELSLTGELEPGLKDDTLVLSDSFGNNIVKYGGLQVFDADNTTLPGHFTLAGRNLRIHVDASEARYPITVDPFIQTARLTASDGIIGDRFGFPVAVSGDTVVVGAVEDDNDTGSVYVFTKPGSGWSDMTQTAKLTASDGVEGDGFGFAIAISGDAIAVGARLTDSWTGSVYVFVKPAGGWADMTQTAKLTASDGAEGDWFGMSVGISGDTIVVGAPYNNSNIGAAYVYARPVSGWADMTQTAKLTASDGTNIPEGDAFGISVAISGDTVVVGAFLDDIDLEFKIDVGSAYVFTKPASGWTDMTETAKLTASDSGFFDIFGSSVAISGDTIVVGAYHHNVFRGAAYVFVQPTSGWTDMIQQTAKLTASDEADDYYLGYSLAISGDIIMVGGLVGDDISYAYVFRKPGGGWIDMTQTIKLTSSDNAAGDYFGSSVAINGDTIVVGAFGKNFKTGAAYIYDSYENGSFSWPIFFPAITNKSVH